MKAFISGCLALTMTAGAAGGVVFITSGKLDGLLIVGWAVILLIVGAFLWPRGSR